MTICSLVIYARINSTPDIKSAITEMEGAQVHAVTDEGKMIVVLDHKDRTQCSKMIMDISNINGVISTSLAYEYHEEQSEI